MSGVCIAGHYGATLPSAFTQGDDYYDVARKAPRPEDTFLRSKLLTCFPVFTFQMRPMPLRTPRQYSLGILHDFAQPRKAPCRGHEAVFVRGRPETDRLIHAPATKPRVIDRHWMRRTRKGPWSTFNTDGPVDLD